MKPVSHNPPESKRAELAPHSHLPEFYAEPADRARVVNNLFNSSASHYDWISSVLSFGSDKYYRRRALRAAGIAPGLKILDVATGTGLVAQAALDLGIPAANLVGLDPSQGMLAENQKLRSIRLVRSIGEKLPFRDRSFDFVVMGYALRHVESLAVLFAEFLRVLRPGGRLLILEISRPDSRAAFFLLKLYMKRFVPLLARLRTSNQDLARLMEYYWATIAECVSPATIVEALRAAGFAQVQRKSFGPILNDYSGQKPGAARE